MDSKIETWEILSRTGGNKLDKPQFFKVRSRPNRQKLLGEMGIELIKELKMRRVFALKD